MSQRAQGAGQQIFDFIRHGTRRFREGRLADQFMECLPKRQDFALLLLHTGCTGKEAQQSQRGKAQNEES